MPDFFIVGAPRCGTTFMHTYLRLHADIFMPERKEPHHFAPDIAGRRFVTREDEYLALFAPAGDARRVGEASVWYLYSQVAARLIREASPAAQAIVMLRDPIEMMRSLHAHHVGWGHDDIADFEAALAAQPDRAAGRRLPPRAPFQESLQYTAIARFGEQLARLLEAFPREAVHVVVLEDLSAQPEQTYSAVLRFLGVAVELPSEFHVINAGRRARSPLIDKVLYRKRRGLRRVARNVLSSRARAWFRTRGLWRRVSAATTAPLEQAPLRPAFRDALREELAADVALLSRLVGRDLAALWWRRDDGAEGTPPSR